MITLFVLSFVLVALSVLMITGVLFWALTRENELPDLADVETGETGHGPPFRKNTPLFGRLDAARRLNGKNRNSNPDFQIGNERMVGRPSIGGLGPVVCPNRKSAANTTLAENGPLADVR